MSEHLPLTAVVMAAPGQTQIQGKSRPHEAPLHTITRQNKEAGVGPYQRKDIPLGLVGIMLGIAVAMGLAAWWINRRAARRSSPEARAFVRLSKRVGVGRAGRALLQDLAREADLPALALVASPGVLGTVLGGVDHTAWRARPGWARVVALAETPGPQTAAES